MPENCTIEDLEGYVRNNPGVNETSFKYLFLLSKNYIKKKGVNLTPEQQDLFSIKAASLCSKSMGIWYKDILDQHWFTLIKEIPNTNVEENSFDSSKLFQNYLLDMLRYNRMGNYVDVVDYPRSIEKLMTLLPKKKNSSEWSNLYISILLSIYKTILSYKETIFSLDECIHPKVLLYDLPTFYCGYVDSIVRVLLGRLRDSFVASLGSNITVHNIKLKELVLSS